MNWASGVTWFPYDNIVMVDDMCTYYVFPGPAPAACMGNLQGRLSAESTLSICQPLTASITGGAACTAKNYHFDNTKGAFCKIFSLVPRSSSAAALCL